MVEIRRYQKPDFPEVKDILEKGGLYWEIPDNEKSLERKIQNDPDSILIATLDNKVVGTLFIIPDFMPFIFRLVVHPDFRNKGIGTELMCAGEDLLKRRGCNHVNILVASEDKKLQVFYERQGYEKGHTYTWM